MTFRRRARPAPLALSVTPAPAPVISLILAPALVIALAIATPAAAAPPIVLYDPGAATPAAPGADLKSATTFNGTTTPGQVQGQAQGQAPQTCGLTTPCTDLNTAAGAQYALPFASTVPYGISGVASAGVSNHGEGGSIGVLAWVKPTDDTTFSIGLSVGANRWTGQKITVVPVAPHP